MDLGLVLVALASPRSLCIDCLRRSGHRFVNGPNFDVDGARAAGVDFGTLVTGIFCEFSNGKEAIPRVVQSLAACIRYKIDTLYVPGCDWLPNTVVSPGGDRRIEVIHEVGRVRANEMVLWVPNFPGTVSNAARSWCAELHLAADILAKLGSDEGVSREIREFAGTVDCP
jgi:hypothetical protein